MTIRLSLDEKLEGFAKSTMNLFGFEWTYPHDRKNKAN